MLTSHLHMEFESASLPETILGRNNNVEIRENVHIIKFYLHPRRFMFFQFLNL